MQTELLAAVRGRTCQWLLQPTKQWRQIDRTRHYITVLKRSKKHAKIQANYLPYTTDFQASPTSFLRLHLCTWHGSYQWKKPDMSMLWMRTGLRILAADVGGRKALQLRTFTPVWRSSFSVLHNPFLVRFKYLFFGRLLNDSQWLFWTWTSRHKQTLCNEMTLGWPSKVTQGHY